MAKVILDNVTKEFEGVTAVDRASLEVMDGEFFTLLGPSGCGKTTTLRLVAGLEYPDSGKVVIGDREVTRVPPARRRIAMVFQNYALYPHMTVRQNIAYPLKLKKTPPAEIESKTREIAERLGIDRVLDRLPAEISGGQQQRTAVARAMVQDPLVYLFDEPLSNLDARLRLESRRFLKRVLKDSGGTAIYVTHDQTEAMALSDRVGVMKDGRLVQVASPRELYSRPGSTFVAGFVGHLPMNLVEGEVAVEGGARFEAPGISLALPGNFESFEGAGVTLGIRPEDLFISDRGDLEGAVEDVEPLGSEFIVTVDCSGSPLIMRLAGNLGPERGEVLILNVPPQALHLFDSEGNRIGP